MQFIGTAIRQARNKRHYGVYVMRCPICGMTKMPIANASRGKVTRPCSGE